MWELAVSAAALYNAVYIPLELAMPAARWSDTGADLLLGYVLDAVFVLDVLLRFRVSFRDHGARPAGSPAAAGPPPRRRPTRGRPQSGVRCCCCCCRWSCAR